MLAFVGLRSFPSWMLHHMQVEQLLTIRLQVCSVVILSRKLLIGRLLLSGNGWQFGKKFDLGELAFYINKYDNWNDICGQPPCGILNPINSNTYDILG